MKVSLTKKSDSSTGKAVEPFYINEAARKEYAKMSTDVLEKLNMICRVWESVTKKPIASEDEFMAVFEDPAKHWRSGKLQENIEQKRTLTLAYIDEGYDPEDIQERITLPEEFDSVLTAVNLAKRDNNINWKNFTWVENGFQLSQYLLNKMDGKVFYHAITPLQQKRLKLANALLKAMKDLEEVMIEEAREAGLDESIIDRVLKEQRFHGPLPYPLRYNLLPNLTLSWNPPREVTINERWVVSGFSQWGGVIGLPTQKNRHTPKPSTPMIYLKFMRKDFDGARRLYIVPKHEKNRAYFGMWREAEIKFLPGEFIIDSASGKLIPNE